MAVHQHEEYDEELEQDVIERTGNDDDGNECYIYQLMRVWDPEAPKLLVVGCNPSNANYEQLDLTMEQVVTIAQNKDYGGVIMCNLYAYRDASPRSMKNFARQNDLGMDYLIGPSNMAELEKLLQVWQMMWCSPMETLV